MKYINADKLISEIKGIIAAVKVKNLPDELGSIEQCLAAAEIEAFNLALDCIKELQQEQLDTKESISHLEHWLAFFGCPEENIEKCATKIAQGYGAIRYLEGIRHGAEAVNELAQQEQPEVELEKEIKNHIKECLDVKFPTIDIELIKKDVAYTARKFYELGHNARKDVEYETGL